MTTPKEDSDQPAIKQAREYPPFRCKQCDLKTVTLGRTDRYFVTVLVSGLVYPFFQLLFSVVFWKPI